MDIRFYKFHIYAIYMWALKISNRGRKIRGLNSDHRPQLSPICCYGSSEHEGVPLAPRSKHRNNKLQSKSDRKTLCLPHLGKSFEEMLRET